MKRLILILFFICPLHAVSGELTHFVDIRNKVAAVAWDFNCTSLPNVLSCSNDPRFRAPTVFIFKAQTGDLVRSIQFFGEECPYVPVDLSANEQELTLTVQTGMGFVLGGDPTQNPYPDCAYSGVTTLRETRDFKTGELLNRIVLENHRPPVIADPPLDGF